MGTGFALWGGLAWAAGGAIITFVIIALMHLQNLWRKSNKPTRWEKDLTRQLVMAHWWGGAVMFGLLSLFTSSLPSAVYTLFTLGVLIGLELALTIVLGGSIMLYQLLNGPFQRAFLVCEPDGKCQG